MNDETEGWKDDQAKLRFDLIPPELVVAIGYVLTFGAAKYGVRNWERGMDWSRVLAAAKRHMIAWEMGEACDEETQMSHLWHLGCCIAFLITYEARKIGTDDRPKFVANLMTRTRNSPSKDVQFLADTLAEISNRSEQE